MVTRPLGTCCHRVAIGCSNAGAQENFFQVPAEEYLIDALADYQVELDEPQPFRPNRHESRRSRSSRCTRFISRNLTGSYGTTAIDLHQ